MYDFSFPLSQHLCCIIFPTSLEPKCSSFCFFLLLMPFLLEHWVCALKLLPVALFCIVAYMWTSDSLILTVKSVSLLDLVLSTKFWFLSEKCQDLSVFKWVFYNILFSFCQYLCTDYHIFTICISDFPYLLLMFCLSGCFVTIFCPPYFTAWFSMSSPSTVYMLSFWNCFLNLFHPPVKLSKYYGILH